MGRPLILDAPSGACVLINISLIAMAGLILCAGAAIICLAIVSRKPRRPPLPFDPGRYGGDQP